MRDTYVILSRLFEGFEARVLVADWAGRSCGRLEVNGEVRDHLMAEELNPGDEIVFSSHPHMVRGTYIGSLRIKVLDIARYPEQLVMAVFIDATDWRYVPDVANPEPEAAIRSELKMIFIEKRVAFENPDELIVKRN